MSPLKFIDLSMTLGRENLGGLERIRFSVGGCAATPQKKNLTDRNWSSNSPYSITNTIIGLDSRSLKRKENHLADWSENDAGDDVRREVRAGGGAWQL